jgi:ABC-type phosphate transport system permease subunit
LEGKNMNNNKISYAILKLMLAFAVGIFVSAFSYGAVSVQAAENEVVISEDSAALADSTDSTSEGDDGGAMILLLGGMLLIIIAVVITVVASFVVTAPIADEI